MNKNALTDLNDLIIVLFGERQASGKGAAALNDFSYDLYPYREKTRNCLRVAVIFSIKGNIYRKNFTINSKHAENTRFVQLKNRAGVSFDIPVIDIKTIYDFIQEIETKYKNNEAIESALKPNPTFKKFTEQYFKEDFLERQPLEKSRINNLIEFWRDYKIKDINYMNIEHFKNEFLKTRTASTVRKYCLLLRSILEISVELGFRVNNPFKNVKLPSNMVENERYPIAAEKLPGLFNDLKKYDDSLFRYCALIYLTGLRPSDVINLTYDNINEQDGIKYLEVKESKLKRFNKKNMDSAASGF